MLGLVCRLSVVFDVCIVLRAKVDSLQEVKYQESVGTKMNDLDLCLEVAIEYLGNRQRQRHGYNGHRYEMTYGDESNGQVTDDIT